MEAIFLPGRVDRESEFVGGLSGACGPNAAAMAERWADQSRLGTLDVYHRMRAAGRCDANGAATLAALAEDAGAAGYRLDVLPYREPMPEADWRAFFDAHVGREALVFETANGQALVDALSGLGENARNLHYHFVLVAGWHPGGWSARAGRALPAGWWCADGDNFTTGDVLQFYPDGVVAAARPCAAMAIYARVASARGGGMTMWTRDSGGAKDSAGHQVGAGMAGMIFASGWQDADGLTGEEYYAPSSSFCALSNGRILTWDGHAVSANGGAQALAAVWAQLLAARQQVAQLQQGAATAQAQRQADQKAEALVAALRAALA
jgi:hypothetical protein